MSIAKFAKFKQLEQLRTFSENNKTYLNIALNTTLIKQTPN